MKHLVWLAVLTSAVTFAQDPPSRVARINLLQGPVSFQPGTLEDWTAATLNYPLTTADHLYTGGGARAELQVGAAAVRLNGDTHLTILNLDDRTVQLSITSGSVNVRVRHFYPNDVFEVDTPNGAVSLLRAGEYRVDCDPNRNATMVTVRNGDADFYTNGESFPVHPNETGYFSEDSQPQLLAANPPDSFDNFAYARDRREDVPPPRYVSQELIGYQDLNEYGTWRDNTEYGPVWIPRVSSGWAPYHDGHWAWVAPWGWTWVDDAPWGFAPFHYGRWAYLGDTWGWCPGPVAVRPVYAPALVAFIGGNNWGASLSFGGGEGVGWFPLGPRDIYRPSYHVSSTYINQVNITNVRNINITTIQNYNGPSYNNVNYINRNVPGAIMAVSRQDFAMARPVQQAGFRVSPQALSAAQIVNAVPIAPQRASVLGGQYRGNQYNLPRPAQQITARPVFVRNTPPPPPVSFAARQQVEAANPGRPVDPATLQRLQQTAPAQRPVQFRSAMAPNPGRPAQQPGPAPYTRQPGQAASPAAPGYNPGQPRPQQAAPNPYYRNQPAPNQPVSPAAPGGYNPNPQSRPANPAVPGAIPNQPRPQQPVPNPYYRNQPGTPQNGVPPNANQQSPMQERQRQVPPAGNPGLPGYVPQNPQAVPAPHQPQAATPAPVDPNIERQRQLQIDQQRQAQQEQQRRLQLERQQQMQQRPPQVDPNIERQRQLQFERQRQAQQEQRRLEMERQPRPEVRREPPPEHPRPAAPPRPAEEKKSDEKPKPNQGF